MQYITLYVRPQVIRTSARQNITTPRKRERRAIHQPGVTAANARKFLLGLIETNSQVENALRHGVRSKEVFAMIIDMIMNMMPEIICQIIIAVLAPILGMLLGQVLSCILPPILVPPRVRYLYCRRQEG